MSNRKIAAARNKHQKKKHAEHAEEKSSAPPAVEETKSTQSISERASNLLENAERRETCCKLMEEFLQSLSEVFPECRYTAEQLEEFRNNVLTSPRQQNMLIKQWHQLMRPLYELADNHNKEFWKQCKILPYFGSIHLQAKFDDPELNQESHDVMWEFIDRINRQVRIYNAVPVNILKRLESAATDMASRIQSTGASNPQDWNWNELRDMSRNVMDSVHPEEINEFMDNIKGLARNVRLEGINDVPRVLSQVPGVSEMMTQSPEMTQMINQIFSEGNLNNIMQTMGMFMNNMNASQSPSQ